MKFRPVDFGGVDGRCVKCSVVEELGPLESDDAVHEAAADGVAKLSLGDDQGSEGIGRKLLKV